MGESVDKIRMRLEPLREDLDELVKNTSDSVFDGALEQAAQLERNLRSVLDDLEEARTNEAEGETIVEPEIVPELIVEEEAVPEVKIAEAAAEAAVEIVEEALHDEPAPEPVAQTEPEAPVEAIIEPVAETVVESVVSESQVVEPEVAEALPEPV